MEQQDQSLDLSAIVEVETTKYVCEECGYCTCDQSNFNKHLRRMHQDTSDVVANTSTPLKDANTTTDSKFVCDQCGKSYKTSYGLSLHTKNIHKKEFTYTCGVCNKGFNQRIQYRFHVSAHAEIPMDKCTYCKLEFSSPSSINRHMDICKEKDQNRPYFCDQCAATFSKKYKLNEHMKGKHGDPTYRCVCGKVYRWRSSLKVHRNVCKSVM